MYPTLPAFLRALESAGELCRVTRTVSPILEIAEVADRHAKRAAPSVSEAARRFDPGHCALGGQGLLFERVEGCDFPLAINVFGSYRRMEMALGCGGPGGFGAIAARLQALVQPQPPRSLRDALAKARQFLPLLRVPPRRVRSGRCQEVVRLTERDEVDLSRLPLIKCWPLDGDPRTVGYDLSPQEAGTAGGCGRYVTFAGMHTVRAGEEHEARPPSHNIGMYRAQLIDRTRLAMHWHMHHDGAAHWRSWKRAGRPMPIAIALGGESVLPYAATSPLPPGLSELLLAGFLNGRGIPMCRARTVPLWVPANSEIVIEGWVSTDCGSIGWDPADGEPLGGGAVFEGPFGDHTGFYSLPDRYPIVNVTAVTHARGAIFPATIVGYPPQEDYYLGKATERIFLPLLRTLVPDLIDYHLPQFGAFHNCAFVQIRKEYPLQARRVMHAVWGAGQMAWTKIVIVVGEEVDVHDEPAVLESVFRNCHFLRDVELVNGPLDILDHAAPRLGAGHKMGLDATVKVRGEEVNGVAVAPLGPLPPVGADVERLLRRCAERAGCCDVHVPPFGLGRCAFLVVDKSRPGQGAAAIEATFAALERDAGDHGPFTGDFLIAIEPGTDVRDWQAVLFHTCANSDPGRDLVRRGHRMGLDATRKVPGDERNGQPVRRYGPFMTMSEDVKARVNAQAGSFGLG